MGLINGRKLLAGKLLNNKGPFETSEDLKNAFPKGEKGDYSIVVETGSFWIWDGSEWKNSVSSVGESLELSITKETAESFDINPVNGKGVTLQSATSENAGLLSANDKIKFDPLFAGFFSSETDLSAKFPSGGSTGQYAYIGAGNSKNLYSWSSPLNKWFSQENINNAPLYFYSSNLKSEEPTPIPDSMAIVDETQTIWIANSASEWVDSEVEPNREDIYKFLGLSTNGDWNSPPYTSRIGFWEISDAEAERISTTGSGPSSINRGGMLTIKRDPSYLVQTFYSKSFDDDGSQDVKWERIGLFGGEGDAPTEFGEWMLSTRLPDSANWVENSFLTTSDITGNTKLTKLLAGSNVIFGTDVQGNITINASEGGSGVGANLSIGQKTPSTLEVTSSSGTSVILPEATATDAGLLSAADKIKLDSAALVDDNNISVNTTYSSSKILSILKGGVVEISDNTVVDSTGNNNIYYAQKQDTRSADETLEITFDSNAISSEESFKTTVYNINIANLTLNFGVAEGQIIGMNEISSIVLVPIYYLAEIIYARNSSLFYISLFPIQKSLSEDVIPLWQTATEYKVNDRIQDKITKQYYRAKKDHISGDSFTEDVTNDPDLWTKDSYPLTDILFTEEPNGNISYNKAQGYDVGSQGVYMGRAYTYITETSNPFLRGKSGQNIPRWIASETIIVVQNTLDFVNLNPPPDNNDTVIVINGGGLKFLNNERVPDGVSVTLSIIGDPGPDQQYAILSQRAIVLDGLERNLALDTDTTLTTGTFLNVANQLDSYDSTLKNNLVLITNVSPLTVSNSKLYDSLQREQYDINTGILWAKDGVGGWRATNKAENIVNLAAAQYLSNKSQIVAGANIRVVPDDNTQTIKISTTGEAGTGKWGGITGNIQEQSDLNVILSSKLDSPVPSFALQSQSPSALPVAGNIYLYAKSDGNFYTLDSSGNEKQVNSSSSATVKFEELVDPIQITIDQNYIFIKLSVSGEVKLPQITDDIALKLYYVIFDINSLKGTTLTLTCSDSLNEKIGGELSYILTEPGSSQSFCPRISTTSKIWDILGI